MPPGDVVLHTQDAQLRVHRLAEEGREAADHREPLRDQVAASEARPSLTESPRTMKLEDLTVGASVKGILPDALVTVISAQWFGSEALELTYKSASGKLGNELIYRHDEPRLE